jgi:hypothetical protein
VAGNRFRDRKEQVLGALQGLTGEEVAKLAKLPPSLARIAWLLGRCAVHLEEADRGDKSP